LSQKLQESGKEVEEDNCTFKSGLAHGKHLLIEKKRRADITMKPIDMGASSHKGSLGRS